MSKQWKKKAISLFLSGYTRFNRRLQVNQSIDKSHEFKNIVIYSTTALGDFLFNSPAIRAVRKRYPSARITLVAHEKFREFLQDGEDWDRVVWWNNKYSTMGAMIRGLKSEKDKPDLALLLHSHEPYDYLSAILAGAQYVIRDNYYDDFEPRDRWLTDYTIGFVGHIIQRKLALVEPLGCEISNFQMKLPMAIPKTRSSVVLTVGFQMGASKPERCWPPENFAKVAEALLSSFPALHISLIGGPEEKGLVKSFWQHIDPAYHYRVTDHVGKTGLKQLTDMISRFSVLLTGDTGPLHIAIAAKTATISLFVTANPYATGPLQDKHLHDVIYVARHKSSQIYSSPMSLIKPDMVLSKIIPRLRTISGSTEKSN